MPLNGVDIHIAAGVAWFFFHVRVLRIVLLIGVVAFDGGGVGGCGGGEGWGGEGGWPSGRRERDKVFFLGYR